jgi:hypothetical protein
VGEHAVALTPWAYVTGSAISLVVFARTSNSGEPAFALRLIARGHHGSAARLR